MDFEVGIRTIAVELGRAASTISRELHRNAHPISGDYRPHAVQARADARRPRPKTRKLAGDVDLHRVVQDHLARKRSPEQIAAMLRREHPDRPEWHVVHERSTKLPTSKDVANCGVNSLARYALAAPCAKPAVSQDNVNPGSPPRW
jgi:hypothetical protein